MKAKSLTTLDTFTMRDDSGELWTFSAQGPLEFTPSHLLEHQAFQFYLTVRYKQTGNELVAISIRD